MLTKLEISATLVATFRLPNFSLATRDEKIRYNVIGPS